MSYNTCRKNIQKTEQPEVYEAPVILNLQNFKRDAYISVICQAAERGAEDRKADAAAHLAEARSQNTGNGILGVHKREKTVERPSLFSSEGYFH